MAGRLSQNEIKERLRTGLRHEIYQKQESYRPYHLPLYHEQSRASGCPGDLAVWRIDEGGREDNRCDDAKVDEVPGLRRLDDDKGKRQKRPQKHEGGPEFIETVAMLGKLGRQARIEWPTGSSTLAVRVLRWSECQA